MCIEEPTRIWIRVGLLLLLAGCAISCYYGPDPPPNGDNNPNTTNATDPTPKHSKNRTIDVITVLGGWPPTPNLTKHWSNWLNEYKTKLDDEKAARGNMTLEEKEKLKKERGNWPSNWQDLGPGHSGEVPPPWAYTPKNTDLPDFCYQWPQRGNCRNTSTRWGFNSHANRCDEFVYSGCGENQNNFKDKLSCEQACMIPPVSGCHTESQIPAGDDYDQVLGQ